MLTKKQKQALDFIRQYRAKKKYAPSLEEIKKHLGLSSVSTAHHHVKKLQEAGYLYKEHNQPRGISPVKEFRTIKIPLLGTITAGAPIEAIEIPGKTVTVTREDVGKSGNHYALRVEGNSMIDEGIFDGDIVVIREQQAADNGQTVVAIIDDNEATLKKFYREGRRIRLEPANPRLFPIYRRSVEIRGVVVKIIRNLESPAEKELPGDAKFKCETPITLDKIHGLNTKIEKRFREKLVVNYDLRRTLVSFQANKKTPGYRWYKFKEGYSSALVDYALDKLGIQSGKILDPFAGSGTSLFASAERGLDTVGVELLPIGVEIIGVRKIIFESNNHDKLRKFLQEWIDKKPWEKEKGGRKINHLKITNGAFPQTTEELLGKFLNAVDKVKNKNYRRIFRFALLCILEEISFTRKDGQYLRWDHRSGRGNGKKKFYKGEIKEFTPSITRKLKDIVDDLRGGNTFFDPVKEPRGKTGNIEVLKGSCLSILPELESNGFDFLITSPPYCNRYDYTRTYALELALLDVDEEKIRNLRQTMMSCTVENREKENLSKFFSKEIFQKASRAFEDQQELQAIIKYLNEKKNNKELNNPGIVRMVKNYFYETTLIIFECARLLKSGAPFVMVNDNVRYAGASIPVDLILSDIAQDAGFNVEKIWVLPTGKGNSSQQMRAHGREELRKCVYVWRKL